ncbi:hypothetical protein GRZ55_11500 [Chelativorans sp. ZYF759]|uniref:hypothetical protein n=1 Tax=Chelativorans sp. ZYF759 TaxID=2692213 RepID=UPI00145E6968|nr:hypothetical protein [Chelativorans sp. ZYF759]NMG39868.1 hypothetical protein [Chelativorans sp. ZYF759]
MTIRHVAVPGGLSPNPCLIGFLLAEVAFKLLAACFLAPILFKLQPSPLLLSLLFLLMALEISLRLGFRAGHCREQPPADLEQPPAELTLLAAGYLATDS